MTHLNLIQVHKTLTQTPVLSGVSLQVESGSLLAILGPSGVGKSTLLRLVAGLLTPDQGDIQFDDESILHLPPEKRRAALVFQENQLFPFMTVAQNIAFGLKLQGLRRQALAQRIGEVLELVQMSAYEHRYPHQLSGGQRQRVALARAIAIRPKLLLLDEPLSNLEVELREALRQEIKTLQNHLGITTLFVTHDQQEAVAIADQIALLMEGRIIQTGSPACFYESPYNEQVARFWGASNIFHAQKQGSQISIAGHHLQIGSSELADGRVLAMIRPEVVQFGANGANTLIGVVQTWQYQGTQSRGLIRCGELELHLSSPPYIHFQPQDKIEIHIQAEHIWLMEENPQ